MARGGDWIARTLDSGGGLLRHSPGSFPGGLSQQGWRDTIDPTRPGGTGVLRADGTRPRPPLADLDTQAATVSALRALAALSGEDVWRQRAEALRARLSKDFVGFHFTVHQLRHTFATLAYRDGVALEVIGAVLTHRSPSSTLIYTHLTAEDLRRVLAERGVLDRVADLLV